jgi:hypothetical protein
MGSREIAIFFRYVKSNVADLKELTDRIEG